MPLSKTEFAALAKRLGPNASDQDILTAAKQAQAPVDFPGKNASIEARPLAGVVKDKIANALESYGGSVFGKLTTALGIGDPKGMAEELSSPLPVMPKSRGEADAQIKSGNVPLTASSLPAFPEAKSLGKLAQSELFPAQAETEARVLAPKDPLGPSGTPTSRHTPSAPGTAPETVPEKLDAYHSPLPHYIASQFEAGKSGADWYAQAMPKVRQMLGPDADKMIDYFAATSPNATVKANTGFAVKALEQDKAGEPFKGYLGQSIDRLNKAKQGEDFGGLKVKAFTQALRGDPNAVVVDRWIARHWGIEKPANAKQYSEIADQISNHANQMGVEPRQLQAALWVAAKKNWGRPGDTAEPFEEVLKDMIAQRPLFNPEGLTANAPAEGLSPVEDLFTSPKVQKYANEVAAIHRTDKGSTYNLRNGDMSGKEAFAVSMFPEREQVLPAGQELKPAHVASFIQKNQDILKDPRASVGTWLVGPEDASARYPAGSTVMSISATPQDLGATRKAAKGLGEEAFYDLKHGKVVPTFAAKAEGAPTPLDQRLSSLGEDASPELLDLEHRSKVSGLSQLDPTKFGTGFPSEESRRAKNYGDKFPPRSFFTRKGGAVETGMREQPYVYDAAQQVPKSRLYDIWQDPENLIALAKEKANKEWGDASAAGTHTMYERLIKDAGYSGFYTSQPELGPHAHSTVVLFDSLPVAQRKGNQILQQGGEDYLKENNLPAEQFADRVSKLNPTNMKKVAKAYAALEHKPDSPEVQKSYAALKKETAKQFDYVQKNLGVKLEPWAGEGQPYANSKEMMQDVGKGHLYFFTGGDMPPNHPLAEVDPTRGLTYNDMFRAVHDVFGHAKEGFQFGPVGEENAFRTHARMFSPEARGAMASETKGQNSWVNFGPRGKANQANPEKTTFAQQKAALLPEEFHKLSGAGAGAFGTLMDKLTPRGEDSGDGVQIGASHDAHREKDIELPNETFGKREDGSNKGNGFLGVLQRPDGRPSTEMSITVPKKDLGLPGAGNVEIPSFVPTLSAKEVKALLQIEVGKHAIPNIIVRKAVQHAQGRILRGQSPFAQVGEDNSQLYPELRRAAPPK